MASVLIIDDDKALCRMIVSELRKHGHRIEIAHDIAEGKRTAKEFNPDLILLDLQMPGGSGLDILPILQSASSCPEVIIITGNADSHSAEIALKSEVWDYLQKPFSIHQLRLVVQRALQYHQEKKPKINVNLDRNEIIGESLSMRRCIEYLARAADSDVSVLVTGETGTGKELFANAIHLNSARKNSSLVILDCTVLPENLIESVLFGHIKGAFTGADRDQPGLLGLANGGTLFLDEIGELSLDLQKKFLRLLQEQVYRPVGSADEKKIDFRLIAATNRNLEEMASRGEFRPDLIYRLRSLIIDLPPLRERAEDIESLVFDQTERICRRYGIQSKTISNELMEDLKSYRWPGNVRELVNTIDRMVTMARNEAVLYPIHLPPQIRLAITGVFLYHNAQPSQMSEEREIDTSITLKSFRESMIHKMEARYLEQLLKKTSGNLKRVAEISGIARSQVYNLLKKHGLRG